MGSEEFDIVIEKGRSEANYWKDLFRFRELFYILSWRDIKVRYRQTVLGFAWALVRPLLTMLIFTFIFSRVAKLGSDNGAPYPLFVLAALLPWQFFSTSLSEASQSLIGNSNLITKVYFPRLIIPASSVITSFVDFLISFVLLLAMMLYYQYTPSPNIVYLPLFLLLIFLLSFGFGLYLTALNVKYRDFRYIIPFIVQFGLYVSPVGFSSNVVPEQYRTLFMFNPLVGIIDGFRWAILGSGTFPLRSLITTGVITVLALIFGLWYFRKTERSFADTI
jgi:lipopolysaccharide transport system permease protein